MAEPIIEEKRMQSYITKVFGWMAGALTLTGVTAYLIANVQMLASFVLGNPAVAIAAIIAQLVCVSILSFKLHDLAVETAGFIFWLYAFLTGVTFSSVFLIWTDVSIASAFLVAAGMFTVMALYGATTEADLTSLGSFLFMGLIGVIIASLINLFLASSAFDLAISMIGVIIFAGLTAYDMQRLQNLAYQVEDSSKEEQEKISIIMSLQLYLDFINLFLFLLRLMGTRRK